MGTAAQLVDVGAKPRISLTIRSLQPDGLVSPLVDVLVSGPRYDVHAETLLLGLDQEIEPLANLQAELIGQATYSIWGLGDYRLEGPLLNCAFTGDGLGHFDVSLELAEDKLRLTDCFVTDQTCLGAFINALRSLGKSG